MKTPISIKQIFASARVWEDGSEELGKELRNRTGTIDVLLVDSGTTALRLALSDAVPHGARVAVPAFGCYDLITAVRGASRGITFYDIDPNTLAPDTDSLRSAILGNVAAVVIAPLFGYPPNMDEIRDLCSASGVLLIEDVAQGGGGRFRGRRLGSWGDFVTFSFGRGKGIGGGGGGALLARHKLLGDSGLPKMSRVSAAQAIASLLAQAVLSNPSLFAIPSTLPWLRLGETVYHQPWNPSLMHPAQIQLALVGLHGSDVVAEKRREVALSIAGAIREQHGVALIEPLDAATPGFLRMGARISCPVTRSLRQLGVRRSYPIALHMHPAASGLHTGHGHYIGSLELSRQLISLPCHADVSVSDIIRLNQRLGRCED